MPVLMPIHVKLRTINRIGRIASGRISRINGKSK